MPTNVHSYHCRCVDWSKNPIRAVSDKEKAPHNRLQHFQLHSGVGVNPGCLGYLRCIGSEKVADGCTLETTRAKVRRPVQVNVDPIAVSGVVLGPQLLTHVIEGELNNGQSVGYHSRARVGLHNSRIVDFKVLSKCDGFGVYFAEFKVKVGSTTGSRKVSAFFPDRMIEREIERAIRIAFINRLNRDQSSINWSGRYENGTVIGGRRDPTGIISAFPAWRDSFDVPQHFLDG